MRLSCWADRYKVSRVVSEHSTFGKLCRPRNASPSGGFSTTSSDDIWKLLSFLGQQHGHACQSTMPHLWSKTEQQDMHIVITGSLAEFTH